MICRNEGDVVKVWIVSVGEPLPVDGENVRLRRMGNLAMYLSTKEKVDVEWFSVSFDHYKKIQRCNQNTDYDINEKFKMHLVYVNGYKKNVSLARIIHHKMAGKRIEHRMRELEKPDIIFSSMEPLEVSKATAKFAKENGIPYIVDVRDLWPEIYYDVIPRVLHPILKIYVDSCAKSLNYTLGNCDSIVGLSNGFLEYGLKYAQRARQEKDAVYPIAYPNYDYNAYKDSFDRCWNKFKLNKEDFIVSFLGNFGDQFKFEEIIFAANYFKDKYKDIKFVLCGNGKNEETVRKSVGENVVIPGWIEKEQILSLMYYSKIGIAPYIDSMNYRLNTPNKFGEYLSAGLPIVVSVKGEMDNLLKENKCGFSYQNSKELTDIIEFYYNNRQIQIEHSQNARHLYEEMFNGDTVNQKIYNHILMVKEENQYVTL